MASILVLASMTFTLTLNALERLALFVIRNCTAQTSVQTCVVEIVNRPRLCWRNCVLDHV